MLGPMSTMTSKPKLPTELFKKTRPFSYLKKGGLKTKPISHYLYRVTP